MLFNVPCSAYDSRKLHTSRTITTTRTCPGVALFQRHDDDDAKLRQELQIANRLLNPLGVVAIARLEQQLARDDALARLRVKNVHEIGQWGRRRRTPAAARSARSRCACRRGRRRGPDARRARAPRCAPRARSFRLLVLAAKASPTPRPKRRRWPRTSACRARGQPSLKPPATARLSAAVRALPSDGQSDYRRAVQIHPTRESSDLALSGMAVMLGGLLLQSGPVVAWGGALVLGLAVARALTRLGVSRVLERPGPRDALARRSA